MPCARQAAVTFDWSRNGCISIWLQTSGSLASRTASSISGTVKLDTPMWRARPLCLTLHKAPSVSDSGICGFGQCRSRRSTSDSRSRARLPLAARSSSSGAKCAGHTLVVMKTSSRRTPEARSRLADLALVVVHLGGIDVAVSEPQRLLDDARTSAPAQLPGAQTHERNARTFHLDEVHHGSRT